VGQDVLTAPSDLKLNKGSSLNSFFMISSDTPYKLAEIIRNTWPQLYRPLKVSYNKEKRSDNEKV